MVFGLRNDKTHTSSDQLKICVWVLLLACEMFVGLNVMIMKMLLCWAAAALWVSLSYALVDIWYHVECEYCCYLYTIWLVRSGLLQMETHYKFKHLWGQELQENNRLFHVFRVWIWFECFMHFSNYRWKYSIFKPNRRDLIKNHRQSPLLKTATTHLLFASLNGSIKVWGTREREKQGWKSSSGKNMCVLVVLKPLLDLVDHWTHLNESESTEGTKSTKGMKMKVSDSIV